MFKKNVNLKTVVSWKNPNDEGDRNMAIPIVCELLVSNS